MGAHRLRLAHGALVAQLGRELAQRARHALAAARLSRATRGQLLVHFRPPRRHPAHGNPEVGMTDVLILGERGEATLGSSGARGLKEARCRDVESGKHVKRAVAPTWGSVCELH